MVGAPFVLGRATCNMHTQDSSRPELGENHHLPPYSILYTSPRGPHPNDFFVPRLPSGSFEIAKVGTLVTLGRHNFTCKPLIEMRSKAEL